MQGAARSQWLSSIGKGRNAADAVATLNPKGWKRFWRTAEQQDV